MIYPEDAPRLGQEFIAKRIECDEMFVSNGIPVTYRRKGNLQQEVAIQLGFVAGRTVNTSQKVGIAVVIEEPKFKLIAPGMMIPRTNIVYNIMVFENNKYNYGPNGVGIEASTIARRITNILHCFASPGVFTILLADDFPFIPSPEDELAGVVDVAYKGTFIADELSGSEDVQKVASVSYSFAGSSMALTCPTDGATIYYTNDGSFPGSTNSTANQYVTPFAVVVGQTINIAAYKSGLLGSDITQTTI